MQAEADLAAALFMELCAFRSAEAQKSGAAPPPCEVGVVTPYRQQKACLKRTFERMAGPAAAAKVRAGTARCNDCNAAQAGRDIWKVSRPHR
jgi:hypothetical protein